MVVIEHAGAEFVHHFGARAFLIDLDDLVVGISGLGVFVETLHVGVRGIAFTVGQAEEAFLQDGIFSIPKRERKAQALFVVGEVCEAVFSPTVGSGASLIVREIVPGRTIAIVVLPDGAPLALAEVGTPFFPRNIFVGYSCRRIFSTGTPGVATADLGLWAAGTLLL